MRSPRRAARRVRAANDPSGTAQDDRRRRRDVDARNLRAPRVIDATPTSFRILDRPVATLRASLRVWTRRLASARASNDRARVGTARDFATQRERRAATRRARVRRARAAFSAAFAVRRAGSFAEATLSIAEALVELRRGRGRMAASVAVDDADENRREDAARRRSPRRRRERARLVSAAERARGVSIPSASRSRSRPRGGRRDVREPEGRGRGHEDARPSRDARIGRRRWRARASRVRADARRVRTIVADAIATAVTDASADATAFGPNGPNELTRDSRDFRTRWSWTPAAHVAADACARLTREFDFEGARRDTRGGVGFHPRPFGRRRFDPGARARRLSRGARRPPPRRPPRRRVDTTSARRRTIERGVSFEFRRAFVGDASSAPTTRYPPGGVVLRTAVPAAHVSPRGDAIVGRRRASDESSDEYESSTVDVASFAAATAIRIERANERADAARRG